MLDIGPPRTGLEISAFKVSHVPIFIFDINT